MAVFLEWEQPGSFVALLEIDATLREGYAAPAIATDNPVEDGSSVSDHTVLGPETILLDGVFTDTPIRVGTGVSVINLGFAQVYDVAGSPGHKARVVNGGLVQDVATPFNPPLAGSPPLYRTRTIYEQLLALRDESTPLRVVTKLRDFENMVIEIFDVERTVDTGQSLVFTLGLKRIKIAQLEQVDAVRRTEKSRANKGRRPGEPQKQTDKEAQLRQDVQEKTLSAELLDGATDFLGSL